MVREEPVQPAETLHHTLRTYGRGAFGGLLFSLPLLYTMEVWWTGHSAAPGRLLALLGGAFVLLVATSWAAGLREGADLFEDLFEAFEELAIGFVTAAVVLALLGQLPASGSLQEWLGKLTIEGAVCALGVSVGRAQLNEKPGGEEDEEAEEEERPGPLRGFVREQGLAALGAVLIAANVAPTEEIVMIAAEASRWGLVGIAALSLVATAVILTASEAQGSDRLEAASARLGPLRGTASTYATALLTAAVLLWGLGSFDGEGAWSALGLTVVLGFPAAIGAAAGRLLLHEG